MPTAGDRLLIFARAPQRGLVKTRLAASVGPDRALAIYRSLTEQLLLRLQGMHADMVVVHSPADAAVGMRAWLGDALAYDAQCSGDLGTRMRHAMATAFADGAERVVVIGTDCPDLTAATVDASFAALRHADVVLGPALDGGYYLIGASEVHDVLFEDIPWSTARTLRVTLDRARDAGLRVALLPALRDIDTVDDWRAYRRDRGAEE